MIPNVRPGALDPIAAPRWILLGDSHGQFDDFRADSRPPRVPALTGVVPPLPDAFLLLTIDPGCQYQDDELPRLEDEAHSQTEG